MRMIPLQDAAGLVLCHDITRIVPGGGKGHAVRPECRYPACGFGKGEERREVPEGHFSMLRR